MTLARAFSDLNSQLGTLRESMVGLHATVAEDKPLEGDCVLTDRFANAVYDVRGALEEALVAASEGQQAFRETLDLQWAWRALITCQESFYRTVRQFSTDLFCYERVVALDRMGRARGGEWRAWAGVVASTLDRCQHEVNDVNEALLHCWQEMGERAELTSVSVKATSVGHQVVHSRSATMGQQG